MAKAKKLASGKWRTLVYDYTDSDGKRHYESFTADTRKESEYLAAEFALMKKGKTEKKSLTFGEALETYITNRSQVLSPASIRKYRNMQRNALKKLENLPLKKIKQEDIQRFINQQAKLYSPKSIRDIHGLISAVLAENSVNLTLNTSMPQKQHPMHYIPSDEDIKKLIDAVKDSELELPVLLAAFGTMRRGEIAALTSDDIDRNIIHVCKTMVYTPDKEWVVKSPKSYAGDRYTMVPDFVAEKLAEKKEKITNLNPNRITQRFLRLLQKTDLHHFRFHDLRHYSASICHALGIPDAYIMQRGGWSNDGVLQQVYRHAMSDRVKDMNQIAIDHFNAMQHEIQHKNKKP